MLDNLYAWHQRFLVERQRDTILQSFNIEQLAARPMRLSTYYCDIVNLNDTGTWRRQCAYPPDTLNCFVDVEGAGDADLRWFWRMTIRDDDDLGYGLLGAIQYDQWQDAALEAAQVIDCIVAYLRQPGEVVMYWSRRLLAAIEFTSQTFRSFQYIVL